MLLDSERLHIEWFEPRLAQWLGSKQGEEGALILAEASTRGHGKVCLGHWLYTLLHVPDSMLVKRLVTPTGMTGERTVEQIEAAEALVPEPDDGTLWRLNAEAVTPPVTAMLDRLEEWAKKEGERKIREEALTYYLLESLDEEMRRLLVTMATEEKYDQFVRLVKARMEGDGDQSEGASLFDDQDKLQEALFDTTGRGFLRRLREDAASMGAKKVSTRHVLYTLLGTETGSLHRALAIRGIDVKKDMHTRLSRELVVPGAKRNTAIELTRAYLLEGVTMILQKAWRLMYETRGTGRISESDIGQAFVALRGGLLSQVLPEGEHVDLASLKQYMASAEEEEEEEEQPLTRLPVRRISEEINKKIRGQEQAVAKIMPWIKRMRFGLQRDGRPAAVLLFMGPTGAGKTQLSKELARYVYGDEDMILFLEMGQFQSKESMSGFVGAPPGYVGYGEGKLTNGLRDKPECVVLFDEIEKAHVQVFDTLLRFSDEGIISDPAGPVRDGRKCIIVMTTNAGQAWLQNEYLRVAEIAKSDEQLIETLARARSDETLPAQLLEKAKEELMVKGFRPEFIGRVDELVTFLPFDLATSRSILDDVLAAETGRIMELRGIGIEIEEDARALMARRATVRTLTEGARGIPRTVNESVISPAIDLVVDAEDEGETVDTLHVVKTGLDTITVER